MRHTTIADVARAAEVSTATVSHALNGTGRIAPATRVRVRSVASALGYGDRDGPPPVVSRTLALAVTTFGPDPWHFADVPFFAQAIAAATAAAHHRGYALTVLPSAPAENLWATLPVAGVLLMDSPADDPVARILRARGLPLAFDGRPAVLRPGEACVDNDHRAMTRQVLGHLAGQGATAIALMDGDGADHYTRTCRAAYLDWCAEHGVRPRPLPMPPPLVEDHGRTYDAVLSGPDRPDAVYGIYDPCGRRILASAARCSLSVPGDLLVVCASEDPAYARADPAVSTVSLDPSRTAEAAVAALVDLIERPGHRQRPVTVPARLHIRATSTRTAAASPYPPLTPTDTAGTSRPA
ncbi:LacI family DNA-binding transcriptional regulator [Streptomyces sp. NPDC048290]|uniref:LacI family DNA-binding transcriptional regulator n=1 Tax=Streptomyces sp. NPDC048290 TaxID=3155811 RepID=UPI0034371FA6